MSENTESVISTPERLAMITFLCIAAFALVLFSEPLGHLLVRRPHGQNGWRWNNDDAQRAAEVLRWLGGMLLAVGLVERLAYAISGNRSPEHNSGVQEPGRTDQ